MITATVTVNLYFEKEINCNECQLQVHNDCDEEWCTATDKYLLEHVEEDDPHYSYMKRHYEGPRPEWCPLQKVEVRNDTGKT